MSVTTKHDLGYASIVGDNIRGSFTSQVDLRPLDLNTISGYTYNRSHEVLVTVSSDMPENMSAADQSRWDSGYSTYGHSRFDPGFAKLTSSVRSAILASARTHSQWNRGTPKPHAIVEVFLSDAGVLTTRIYRRIGQTSGRGNTTASYPLVSMMQVTVLGFVQEGVPSGDLKWYYLGQPDLVSRGITTGQPPDLVAIDINVDREDVSKWSYQLGNSGYNLTTQTYGNEFDVNRGTSTKVYQVRQGEETLILKGKDSVGNIKIARQGTIRT